MTAFASSMVSERFKQDVAAWRALPVNRLLVAARRRRADELRRLLSDPDLLDLAAFDREVWRLGKVTVELPDGSRKVLDLEADAESADLGEVEAAIAAGRVAIHGNGVWRPASQIYDPTLKDEPQKLGNLRRALAVLNDPALEPIEKATRINQVRGFGDNTATGLVMMFHPGAFALRNAQSNLAFEKLGIRADSLEAFQDAAERLRDELELEDFLELDWVLYCVAQERLDPRDGASPAWWWVNQGASYKTERDGGYLWAPHQGRSGRTFDHHRNLGRVKAGDVVVHYAEGRVRAAGLVLEPPADAPKPSGLERGSLETLAWGERGYLVRIEYRELSEPVALQELPPAWRGPTVGPFDRNGDIKQGYLYPLAPAFACTLVRAVRRD